MRQGPEDQRSGEAGAAPVRAADWYASLPPPIFASAPGGEARVRRDVGLAEVEQPALHETLLCLHLGGAKRIRRRRGGGETTHDVDAGMLSILPRGQASGWSVAGPADAAQLVLRPEFLARIACEEFDREGAELPDLIGLRNPEIEGLFRRLLPAVESRGAAGRLYPDCLLVVLATTLIAEHAVRAGAAAPAYRKGGLAGWRLRRVVDYMAANLAHDIDLAELTTLTGLSRAQFFRAFKQSTGSSPHRFLAGMRLDRAKALLETSELAVADIASAVGLGDTGRLTAAFRVRYAVSPSFFRLSRA
jgi:AraC family transcriptional regulator